MSKDWEYGVEFDERRGYPKRIIRRYDSIEDCKVMMENMLKLGNPRLMRRSLHWEPVDESRPL